LPATQYIYFFGNRFGPTLSEQSLSLCEHLKNHQILCPSSGEGLYCLSTPSQGLHEDNILLIVFIVTSKVGESSVEKASGILSKHTKQ